MRREKRYEETMASQSLDDGKKEENEKIEEVLKMKNKRLMGIIGLIAAAVIGTAIYSATAPIVTPRQSHIATIGRVANPCIIYINNNGDALRFDRDTR